MSRRLGGFAAALLRTKTSPLPPHLPAAEYHSNRIEAIPREYVGRRVAAKERAQGRVPAVVLTAGDGGVPANPKQLLTIDAGQIQSLLIREPYFCSKRFAIDVLPGPGSAVVLNSGNVLPIKVHKEEATGKLLNLVFVWAEAGNELKVDVPIAYKGEDVCPGLKKGGFLRKIRTTLRYLCPAEHIPPKIEVDVRNLDVGDRVSLNDVKVHPLLKLLSKNDAIPICKVVAAA